MSKKSIDLHGIKHTEAFRVIDNFIGSHIVMGTGEVEIITGMSKPMKTIVNDVLKDYGVKSREDILNGGKLIINLR